MVASGTAPAIDQGISGAITTALSSKSIACAERSDSSSVSEHDGEGLVAGERRRASRGNHGGTTCAEAMAEHLDDLLQPSKHPRLGKNAGVSGRDADNGHHSEHGEDTTAVQQCGHLRILRMVTENKQPQQFRPFHVLHAHAYRDRGGNAGEHKQPNVHTQQRQHDDQ